MQCGTGVSLWVVCMFYVFQWCWYRHWHTAHERDEPGQNPYEIGLQAGSEGQMTSVGAAIIMLPVHDPGLGIVMYQVIANNILDSKME